MVYLTDASKLTEVGGAVRAQGLEIRTSGAEQMGLMVTVITLILSLTSIVTVIIASLVGAGALGLVAYGAAVKPLSKLGEGVAGGVSIVVLAIMLDRITQAWGRDTGGERR